MWRGCLIAPRDSGVDGVRDFTQAGSVARRSSTDLSLPSASLRHVDLGVYESLLTEQLNQQLEQRGDLRGSTAPLTTPSSR